MSLVRTCGPSLNNCLRIGEDILVRVRRRGHEVSVEIVAPRSLDIVQTTWPEGRRLEELLLSEQKR